ncbi:hypothetical protein [Streptomyces sp. NPDC088812]|uniref:hypothetical protein n=1 Tax=Streptomyces sp. NPDC088812 TaxID=3365905 RepID=UPI00380E3375
MSGLDELFGDLDRPGTPGSPGAWDERSEGWLSGESGRTGERRRPVGRDQAGGDTHPGESPAERHGERHAERHAERHGERRREWRSEGEERGSAGAGGRGRGADTSSSPRAEAAAPRGSSAHRRGAADPVKVLMHRHRALCERAVDPLEIAAALEAHGITDRTAARFRHRDVFSLAEEMYARVPRDGDTPPQSVAPEALPRARADWALLTLLPGALCAATVAGARLTQGQTRAFVVAAGVLAVVLALGAALRRGPLSLPDRPDPGPHRAGGWTCWLLVYAALGDGFLRAAAHGGPDGLPTGAADGPWPLTAAPLVALTLACAPAAWSAHLLAVRARRRLNVSRGLEEFAASVQPLVLGTFALFLCALAALTGLCAAALGEPAGLAQVLTLGALLHLARLLTVHGFPNAPALALGAAGAAEGTALASVFAARLPGCGFLATPVDGLLAAWGPAGVPALCCGAAALALLVHATRTLARASAHAHAHAEQPC